MAEAVYLMCAFTSLLCAGMLFRSYRRMRLRLLFWSSACFACIALTNVLLFVDLALVPGADLSLLRNGLTLTGLLMLLYGLIWDTV